MIVLSLFDGISCGQLALQRANIEVDKYFASEIKDFAIQVTQCHFPRTIQIGDVTKVSFRDGVLFTENGNYEVGKIDLLIGGSPCQNFSQSNSFYGQRNGLEGEKSSLFYHFKRIKEECNPTYFLLENVKMKKEWIEVLNDHMGVKEIFINSSLVSAQHRPRLYWTNIPNVGLPQDKEISLQNIFEKDQNILKEYKLNKTPSRDKMWNNGEKGKFVCKNITNETKSSCLTRKQDRFPNAGLISFEDYARILTPLECERLQTLPENYTSMLSKTKRYDVIGDGWTVDVVAHIFEYMKKDMEKRKRRECQESVWFES